jgi:hypothetical protein
LSLDSSEERRKRLETDYEQAPQSFTTCAQAWQGQWKVHKDRRNNSTVIVNRISLDI